MDVSAILNADDELLKDMGLIKDGDRVSLRGFCKSCSLPENEQSDEKKNKKKRLLEAFWAKRKGNSHQSSLRNVLEVTKPFILENQKK